MSQNPKLIIHQQLFVDPNYKQAYMPYRRKQPNPSRSIAALLYYTDMLAAADRLTPRLQEALDKAHQIRAENEYIYYIAGALTGVDEATKDRFARISELIQSYNKPMFGYAPHLHGTDPVHDTAPTPNEVHDIDYLWARILSDAHINFWWPVAHGNAVEAGWAEQAKIPTVYMLPTDFTASRLIRGMTNITAEIRYVDFETDGIQHLKELLDPLAASLLPQA